MSNYKLVYIDPLLPQQAKQLFLAPMGGGEFVTSKLDKELTNRLGNSSIESCVQRAESWIKVSALLDELVPDWKNGSATTRGGEALNAISGLVTRIAEMERLVRVNREQQTLLDQIYQYVDDQGLAKLGQSRVEALIEAHKRAETEIDLRRPAARAAIAKATGDNP